MCEERFCSTQLAYMSCVIGNASPDFNSYGHKNTKIPIHPLPCVASRELHAACKWAKLPPEQTKQHPVDLT